MNTFEKGMIYPVGQDPKAWAKRYNIVDLEPCPCFNCGKLLMPEVPFATGDWRGLMSKPHLCGPDFDYVVAVKSTPQGRQEYIDLFRDCLEHLT